MKYNKLGHSNIQVSDVCLGTMTWGIQNTQEQAEQQMDYALDSGINFFDTAEMYPVPPNSDTYGETERVIGRYFAKHPDKRQKVTLATKIAGPGLSYIRDGSPISGKTVKEAVEASLKRLQIDCIDVYQLHWPNRTSPHFGKHFPNHISFSNVNKAQHIEQMHEILQALGDCVKQGTIKHCGLSDDTTWGINQYLKLAENFSLPKMVSIQNEFNLLHSKDWPYLIENCVHEEIAYLPWSPLAGGSLTGKYLNGSRPAGSRWTLVQRNGLFRDTPNSDKAIEGYCAIAKDIGITPAQLALAWCKQVDGVTSTIIGATTMSQLKENIDAFAIELSQETKQRIHQVLTDYPAPF
jgi:aryl-alcohol dehydrogenase-like predicted oxidoreductase